MTAVPGELAHLFSSQDGRAKEMKQRSAAMPFPTPLDTASKIPVYRSNSTTRSAEISRSRSARRRHGCPFPQPPQTFHLFPFKRAKSHYQQMKRLFPWRTLQPVRLKKRDHSGKPERQPRNNKKPSGTKNLETTLDSLALINRRRFSQAATNEKCEYQMNFFLGSSQVYGKKNPLN